MGGKVYSYMRFSDARQAAGASSDRQGAYAAKWATDHGLQLDDSLSMRDEGLSAFHQKHITAGALGVFLKAVTDGLIDSGSVLVVEGLDRLSRAEPIQAQAQLASIINAGISVVTASDGKVYSRERLKANPMDLVYSLLVMIRAHEESDTKSKRVRDAIRRQCMGWKAGTYRGLIRYGQIPGWLQVMGGQWELIPERAAAVRLAVEMCLQGIGSGHIVQRLHAQGLRFSGAIPTSGHLQRLLTNPALIGEKHLQVDGEVHELVGYYPAVLERDVWQALQDAVQLRGRKAVRGEIPAVLTGIGVTVCGYCGAPMKSQTMANKRKPDGTLADGHRRLKCMSGNSGQQCLVPGSCSAAPVERALIAYCADLVNLQALYRGDQTALPRAELEAAQTDLDRIDTALQRLTDALLASTDAPAAFTRRAIELEAQRASAVDRVQAAERALASAARADTAGADARWRSIAAGVQALDYAARVQARQLVSDTFERIAVYHHGMRPVEGEARVIDIVLAAKGGTARLLRIDPKGLLLTADAATI